MPAGWGLCLNPNTAAFTIHSTAALLEKGSLEGALTQVSHASHSSSGRGKESFLWVFFVCLFLFFGS